MALRLSDLVVCGEIFNTRPYSTHGWLGLRDHEQPLVLQLTGNCAADLVGRHFRFEVRQEEDEEDVGPGGGGAPEDAAAADLPKLAWQQVGPTGTMTAARRVKVADCSATELVRRTELGEPPPMEWKRCLYLEWFSQNGRVVVELVDPIIEFIAPNSQDEAETSGIVPPRTARDDLLDEDTHGPSAAADDGTHEEAGEPPGHDAPQKDETEADDAYRLIPEELERQFEIEASETDRAIENDEEKSQLIRELELMDDLIEHSDGEPVGSLFDTPLRLPRPDQLSDADAEPTLKVLLAQLALHGIALDICKHFTPRDAYRLLLEEICVEERAYPELRQTQWVQHFMTSEFCKACEAEFDREYQENERRRKTSAGEDTPGNEESSPGGDPPC